MPRINGHRLLGAVALAGALVMALAAPAGAHKVSSPARPADAITGQEHPAQVFAFSLHYVPSTVTIRQGESLTFGNYDPVFGVPAHSLDEVVPDCTAPPYTGQNCRYPRFSSGLVDHGYVHHVNGVESLPPGTYEFTCQVHPFMRGTLVVR